jgi:membrane protease YdiL (CAAX protease family)
MDVLLNSDNYAKVNFKRSFWIIFVLISLIQIFDFALSASFGFDFDSFPPRFFFYSHSGGLVWYFILAGTVILDLQAQNVSPARVFNFGLKINKQWVLKILKYGLICILAVPLLSLLSDKTEMHLEFQNSGLMILAFINAVILAPVFEEMAFRGYLYTAMFSSFKRKKERLVVNAMLFACAHVFLIEFILGASVPYYIFILGYLLADLYEETRSILPCILLHAFNNGLVFLIDIMKLNYL